MYLCQICLLVRPLVLLLSIVSTQIFALEPLSETELSDFSGQGGVYLSGDIALNDIGGPLALGDAGNESGVWGTCLEKDGGIVDRCGARISFKTNTTDAYVVLDELRGKMSFEGLTLKARELTLADNAQFGGDVTDFLDGSDGKTVLEVGLPNEVRFENLGFTVATSNTARPTDQGFNQKTVFSVDLNGSIKMHGNLLIFP